MADVKALRAEAQRVRKAVTRKISRIKTNTGAQLSGTEFDPRRSTELPKRYTAKQLNAYIQEMQGFLSRGNQFVSGAHGTPIPRDKWNEYKAQERQFNQRAIDRFNKVKDIQHPESEMSLGEYMAMKRPLHPEMHKNYEHVVYDPPERVSQNMKDLRALDKWIRTMEQRNAAGWDEARIDVMRETADKMFDRYGDGTLDELRDAVHELSDDQFWAMWNFTDFASDQSLYYVAQRNKALSKSQDYDLRTAEDAQPHMRTAIEWAARLPRNILHE